MSASPDLRVAARARAFVAAGALLLVAKAWLAISLPLLVDETFYAWEARYPALAYSDLPGLTAWLARLGTALGGTHALALRAPFLLLGAAVPWLVVRIARRWFGDSAGWTAGLLAMALPLCAMLGLLALPDVPLVFAALLCVDAIAALRERVTWGAAAVLALALAMGALTHYRFALVIAAGLAGMVMDARARRLLAAPPVWCALVLGALAWWPLLHWNLQHAGAGVQFQVVERNPWAFDWHGAAWPFVQLLLVTPVLFVLLLATLRHAWAAWRAARGDAAVNGAPWGLVAGIGLVAVLGYFLVGFFVDRERVSFHWPLSGWLVLACAAPVVLARWPLRARQALWLVAGVGVVAAFAFVLAARQPALRARLAGTALYPKDFAGTAEAQAVGRALAARGAIGGRTLVASDFAIGSQLAFALDRRDVRVLDSALNHKHGRAAQLADWGLQLDAKPAGPALFLLNDSGVALKERLALYHRICDVLGPITRPAVTNIDHGQRRVLAFDIAAGPRDPHCVTPAIAWIDAPRDNARVDGALEVSGWAFKDGSGLRAIDVTLDGVVVAQARYGEPMPHVADYWRISTDPNHPRVGFRATVDASGLAPGTHWLGLVLHGADGSVEAWPEQRLRR